MSKPAIEWSLRAKKDVEKIYFHLREKNSVLTSQKIIAEISSAPEAIIFPEQYQFDDYITDCRRIIIRHYKILYHVQNETISIVSVFDSRNNPLKMSS
ncbi:type II toxin-antitoxin system RelE/ParE family toxin [Flavobacterium sp. RHBU_24]|uniref:type II toxin-antitoxin system RelE/ParE family toxin n=1 Tax=Flavobacterium sp. RHBU_24 TaxID=3391185 RepID=UPI0039851AC3